MQSSQHAFFFAISAAFSIAYDFTRIAKIGTTIIALDAFLSFGSDKKAISVGTERVQSLT